MLPLFFLLLTTVILPVLVFRYSLRRSGNMLSRARRYEKSGKRDKAIRLYRFVCTHTDNNQPNHNHLKLARMRLEVLGAK